MKKFIKIGILFGIILLISGCGSQKNMYMTEISYNDYKDMINNKETFILEIMRTECTACINFKPNLEAVLNKYKIEIKFINTDHLTDEEYEKLADDTGITGTPTVIFYNDGEEETVSSRINGSVSEDKIISKFKASGFIN